VPPPPVLCTRYVFNHLEQAGQATMKDLPSQTHQTDLLTCPSIVPVLASYARGEFRRPGSWLLVQGHTFFAIVLLPFLLVLLFLLFLLHPPKVRSKPTVGPANQFAVISFFAAAGFVAGDQRPRAHRDLDRPHLGKLEPTPAYRSRDEFFRAPNPAAALSLICVEAHCVQYGALPC
jgi:hypothetical protein